MSFILHIEEAAFLDIADGVERYETYREGLSMDFELCLEEGYSDILLEPFGYQFKYKEVRVKYIRRFPYGIHYLVENKDVYVIGVFHTSKSPNNWFKRITK